MICVEHQAGADGRLQPVAICFEARRLRIREIIDRWPAHDYSYIKVCCEDGAVYILRHDLVSDRWQVTMYSAAQQPIDTIGRATSNRRLS